MKNYAILKSDVFLYGYLTHGRYYQRIMELCEKGKLTLIYNDNVLDDYKSISYNIMNKIDDEFFTEIEKIKKHGINLNEEEIRKLTKSNNITVYKVIPSALSIDDKSAKANCEFAFIELREIEQL